LFAFLTHIHILEELVTNGSKFIIPGYSLRQKKMKEKTKGMQTVGQVSCK
jgi:hypothetical protein